MNVKPNSPQPVPSVPGPEIVLEHADWVRGLARALVQDDALAEDLAQDALRALESAGGRVQSARAYLAQTVRQLAWKVRRGDERRRRREERYSGMSASVVPSAADAVERVDTLRVVIEELHELSEAQQRAIVLRYFDGLSAAEIARRDGVAAATVRSQLARGLARLRERLDERFDGRDAWAFALIPWATGPIPASPLSPAPALSGPAALPAAALTSAGALVMLTKTLAIAAL
ncbi:MAG: RNA polymerase sigma factor, partial [Planctomycetota bacterium]